MPEPPNIITAKIDPKSGLLAYPGEKNAIFEIFRKQYAPQQIAQPVDSSNSSDSGDGGLTEQWGQPLF